MTTVIDAPLSGEMWIKKKENAARIIQKLFKKDPYDPLEFDENINGIEYLRLFVC